MNDELSKNTKPAPALEIKLTAQELQLIERLRAHPQLLERFQSILAITASGEGPVKKADEVEGLLIEEVRRLGQTSLESWASRAESTLAGQLKEKEPSARVRKKKRGVAMHFAACLPFASLTMHSSTARSVWFLDDAVSLSFSLHCSLHTPLFFHAPAQPSLW